VLCSEDYGTDYIKRNPCITTLDTTPLMSEHEIHTDRVLHRNQGMRHFEGGWPENVDSTEADQVDRYLKKTNKVRARQDDVVFRLWSPEIFSANPFFFVKDHKYKSVVAGLAATVESAVKQNNSVDIFEDYFEKYDLDLHSE
jgi:dynein intermediate chain 2